MNEIRPNTETLKDKIYANLFSDIINGVYSVNTILTEKYLMEKYSVSRAPIREALLQLSEKKLLYSIPRQGYKLLQPDTSLILEIARFRAILEPSFLERYASCLTKDCLKELRHTCQQFANYKDDDFLSQWKANCTFHLKIFSMYNNSYAYQKLKDALDIQTLYFVQTKHYHNINLHLAVIDYLEKNDIMMAKKILQADIENLIL